MMNQYKGTQTEQNLTEAYAIESKARNKYTFFATTAQREGYEQIAAIFLICISAGFSIKNASR